MDLLRKFFSACSRTDLEQSTQEEDERYSYPPRLATHVNWWWNYRYLMTNYKDGLDDNNPYKGK